MEDRQVTPDSVADSTQRSRGRARCARRGRRASPTGHWSAPRWPRQVACCTGALDSEDTRVMIDALRPLGNRGASTTGGSATISLAGCGGRLPARRRRPVRRQQRHVDAVPDGPGRPGPRHVTGWTASRGCATARSQICWTRCGSWAPTSRSELDNGCPPVLVQADGLPGGSAAMSRRHVQPVPQRPVDGRAVRRATPWTRGRRPTGLAALRRHDAGRDGGVRRRVSAEAQLDRFSIPARQCVSRLASTRSNPTPRPPATSWPRRRSPAGE